ncbi:MAG: glycosyltransferase [Myxococcales bacterium]|nr:glycosyltransferase [Myxococcales bacterium]
MQCPRLDELPPVAGGGDSRGWPYDRESTRLAATAPDGGEWPRISVVTPSYEQAPFLEKTLRSILLQGYPNLELIVIDGASRDGSLAIIERYAPYLSHWVCEPDGGQSDALNKGFARASGEILSWLNSDDIFLPDTLAAVVDARRRDPDCDAWIGLGHKVDERGRLVHVSPRLDLSLEGVLDWPTNHFAQPACFFSRRAWELAGPLSTELHYCMDFDLWLRMLEGGLQFAPIERVLALMLAHPAAKTTGAPERMLMEIALVMDRHGAHQLARRTLDEMADELSRFRRYKSLIDRSPLWKPLLPLWKRLREKILSR